MLCHCEFTPAYADPPCMKPSRGPSAHGLIPWGKAGTHEPAARAAEKWTLAFARDAFKFVCSPEPPCFSLVPTDVAAERRNNLDRVNATGTRLLPPERPPLAGAHGLIRGLKAHVRGSQ